MPKAIEEALKKSAKKLISKGGLKKAGETAKEATNRYVYGSSIMQRYMKNK